MKLLIISNLYPPHVIGGYEALCMEVVEGLEKRGHETRVLTSIYGVDNELINENVYRLLVLESDLQFYQPNKTLLYPIKKFRNIQLLRKTIAEFKPDIVFVWGMWNMTNSLAYEAEKMMPGRVVYYLANPWPIEPNMHQAYWDMPAKSTIRNWAKRFARIFARVWLYSEWKHVPLRFKHAPCCSIAQREQLLNAGIVLQDAPVIYEGVDLQNYLVHPERNYDRNNHERLALVYVGILAEHKGVHTTIEALSHLTEQERQLVSLTILGTGHTKYEKHLHELVINYQLSGHVTFVPPIPRSELPDFLNKFQVLLLPSVWSEPLARIMQEGLASGMVVVGSSTGGTAETISHGENGLLFTPGDANELAEQIKYLLAHPNSFRRLAKAGRDTAIERFNIEHMIVSIEQYLERVNVNANTSSR